MSIKEQALLGTLGGLGGGLVVAAVFRAFSTAPLQEVAMLIGLGVVVGAALTTTLIGRWRRAAPRRSSASRAPTKAKTAAQAPAKKSTESK